MAAQLTIIEAPHGAAQTSICDALAHDLVACGMRVARLAVNSGAAHAARRRLADTRTATPGVEIATLDGWARGRWELFGDGRAIVGPAQRRALVMSALARTPGNLLSRQTAGMVPCIEGIVRESVGVPAFEQALATGCAEHGTVSDAERELLAVCALYLQELDTRNLVEAGRAWAALPAAMGTRGWSHLILEGPHALTDSQVELVAQAAAHQGVTYVARLGTNPAFEAAHQLAARLTDACAQLGVPTQRLSLNHEGALDPQAARNLALPGLADALKAGTPSPWRAPELEELAEALFAPRRGEPVEPQGCVRFCLPAGRYAEPELIAKTIQELVYEGYAPRGIAVACHDPLAMARSVAGRLAQTPGRAVAVLAQGGVSLAQTNVGRALANMLELACAADPRKPAPHLRTVASDLARNPLAGIGAATAIRLDRSWRGKRAHTAQDFLADLVDAANAQFATSAADTPSDPRPASATEPASPLAQAASLVSAGDLAQAALVLGKQVAGVGVEALLERAAATKAAELASHYAQANAQPLAPSAWRILTAGASVPTSWTSVPASDVAAQRIAAVMDSNPNAVRFVRPGELEGCSYSAVLLCGLTANAYSVASRNDAQTTLWEKLGIDTGAQRIDEMRWQFMCALEAARDLLVLERRLQDEDAKELRPAALLEELVDCYRTDPTDFEGASSLNKTTGLPSDGSLSCTTLGEERFAQLAAPVTLTPATLETPLPTLVPIHPDSRDLLVYEGQLWSPSALELLLSCPLRWFYERRLPHETIDAGFGPLEFGTFCHSVLQLFHERLPQLGLDRIEPHTDARAWAPLLDACFDEVLGHQRDAQNPLVPITALEREKLEATRRSLHDCVARDAQLPAGFVPRRHEWSFGTAQTPPVEYGGVLLRGTVDRIDEDEQGRALVIDYKGKLGDGYEPPRAKRGQDPLEVDRLPLHSQALMYAGALRRAEGREVVGALYVSYAKPQASGFLDTTALGPLDPEKGAYLGERNAVHAAYDGSSGFVELLDYVEGEVADAIERLRLGIVAPSPRYGAKSCAHCSVAGCPHKAAT